MVTLDEIRASNSALMQTQPLVGVFVGGTAGIGEHAARALATAHGDKGKGLRIYIVGRNEASGKRVISECQKVCPTGQYRFVRASDLSLLEDVDRVSKEIVQAEEKAAKETGSIARIDLLVMTQAPFEPTAPRRDTKEGLDLMMSCLYYSRMRFTTQLMPLLLASSLPARVVSVFGPGRDQKIITEDLSLRDPKNYGFMDMGSHAAYFTTFFMEHLAATHPGQLSLIHYYPRLVLTDTFWSDHYPWWLRWTFRGLGPLIRPFTIPQMESGERVIFHASPRYPARSTTGEPLKSEGKIGIATSSDGVVGGGAYRGNWNADVVPLSKEYKKLREDGMYDTVLAHTTKAFEDIEAGKAFTG